MTDQYQTATTKMSEAHRLISEAMAEIEGAAGPESLAVQFHIERLREDLAARFLTIEQNMAHLIDTQTRMVAVVEDVVRVVSEMSTSQAIETPLRPASYGDDDDARRWSDDT